MALRREGVRYMPIELRFEEIPLVSAYVYIATTSEYQLHFLFVDTNTFMELPQTNQSIVSRKLDCQYFRLWVLYLSDSCYTHLCYKVSP